MADISLQSEKFIALYEKAEPALQRLVQSGPVRAFRFEMPAHSPGQVLERLGLVKQLAEQGVEIAGPAASYVVLTGNELSMLQWALQQR